MIIMHMKSVNSIRLFCQSSMLIFGFYFNRVKFKYLSYQKTKVFKLQYANSIYDDKTTSIPIKLRDGKHEVRQYSGSLTSRKIPGENVSYSEGKKTRPDTQQSSRGRLGRNSPPSVQTTARWFSVLLWIFCLFTLNMDLLNKNPASKKSFLWRLLKKIQN